MIALDPSETLWISLKADEAKPETTRPAFECRYLTVAQARKIRRALDAAMHADDDKAESIIREALTGVLVNWRNVPGTFAVEGLAEVLTITEMFELAASCVHKTSVSEWDRKKSVSPSDSAGAQPVSAAPAASA